MAIPFATSALARLLDNLSAANPLGAAAVFSGMLLWPPMIRGWAMMRVGSPDSEVGRFLAEGAAMNAVTYAVTGALLWYALYRRRWAWLAVVALLAVFWWPIRGVWLG